MLSFCFVWFGFGVDGHVVHINCEPSFRHFRCENGIHHGLKGRRGVGESEEHYSGFEQSLVGNERCLPLIPILDSDIIVAPPYVELSVLRTPLGFRSGRDLWRRLKASEVVKNSWHGLLASVSCKYGLLCCRAKHRGPHPMVIGSYT